MQILKKIIILSAYLTSISIFSQQDHDPDNFDWWPRFSSQELENGAHKGDTNWDWDWVPRKKAIKNYFLTNSDWEWLPRSQRSALGEIPFILSYLELRRIMHEGTEIQVLQKNDVPVLEYTVGGVALVGALRFIATQVMTKIHPALIAASLAATAQSVTAAENTNIEDLISLENTDQLKFEDEIIKILGSNTMKSELALLVEQTNESLCVSQKNKGSVEFEIFCKLFLMEDAINTQKRKDSFKAL